MTCRASGDEGAAIDLVPLADEPRGRGPTW
jgi:hypothetical protein